MGRPKLYQSDEERLAAGRERSARYYSQKRAYICEKRRLKYEESKKGREVGQKKTLKRGRPRAPLLTDEEKKLKDRLKSARYYQRKKSEIKSRRQNGRANGHPSDVPATRIPFIAQWEKHLAYHAAQLPKLLGKETLEEFLRRISLQFIEGGIPATLEAACKPFNALDTRISNFQGELYNKVGAGAEIERTKVLLLDVRRVIWYIEDLEIVALSEGRDAFREQYLAGQLAYQTDHVVD